MSVKRVFNMFLGHVHKEVWTCVEREIDFDWVKLFKEKPKVVEAEEDEKAKFVVSHAPYTHHFLVEEKRFKYTRVSGKERYKFKAFDAMENWAEFERYMKNIRKRAKPVLG